MSAALAAPADHPTGTWEPSLDNQVQELERQIHFLENYTLPSQVAARRTSQSQADQVLRTLRAAARNLRFLRDGEYILAIAGEASHAR
jgi:hypothetical protein